MGQPREGFTLLMLSLMIAAVAVEPLPEDLQNRFGFCDRPGYSDGVSEIPRHGYRMASRRLAWLNERKPPWYAWRRENEINEEIAHQRWAFRCWDALDDMGIKDRDFEFR